MVSLTKQLNNIVNTPCFEGAGFAFHSAENDCKKTHINLG